MKIAILGFGTVGSGVYEIAKSLKNIEVKKVLEKDLSKINIATDNYDEIINDKEIELVVECMGGLHPAYEFIMKALQNKKSVVSANKAVIAKYLDEFLKTAKENNVEFRFEASVGGGIPCLAGIQKIRRVENIDKFYGIFNGTSNFILDNMYRFENEFFTTLKTAQELGYAEADPSADIDGYDVHMIRSFLSLSFLTVSRLPICRQSVSILQQTRSICASPSRLFTFSWTM